MNEYFESLLAKLESPETKAAIDANIKAAQAKYKPIHDWEKANPGKPKNLYEAVIRRETYKAAIEKVYGPGAYDAI